MRRFLLNTAAFFLPVVFIGICCEIMLRKIPNDYSYKNKYLDKNASVIEVLALGSSHSYSDIDPQYLRLKGFNASNASQTIEYDYAIFKKYSSKWNNLKFIILPVDDFTLYLQLKKAAESWRIKNYEIYYGIHLSGNLADNSEILSNKLVINAQRLYRYYIRRDTNTNCSLLGWGFDFNSKKKQSLTSSAVTAAKRHTISNKEFFSQNVRILTELVKDANSRNIHTILYTSPVYSTYTKYANKRQMAVTVEIIERLRKIYPNVSYYDWYGDKSFIESDFFDADHLNEIGARKMTLRLDSIINVVKNRQRQTPR